MTLKELLEMYKGMHPARRWLLVITVIATLVVIGLVTEPQTRAAARGGATLAAVKTSNCATTTMRVSILGRSLMTYDWQSGDCLDAAARLQKASQ